MSANMAGEALQLTDGYGLQRYGDVCRLTTGTSFTATVNLREPIYVAEVRVATANGGFNY